MCKRVPQFRLKTHLHVVSNPKLYLGTINYKFCQICFPESSSHNSLKMNCPNSSKEHLCHTLDCIENPWSALTTVPHAMTARLRPRTPQKVLRSRTIYGLIKSLSKISKNKFNVKSAIESSILINNSVDTPPRVMEEHPWSTERRSRSVKAELCIESSSKRLRQNTKESTAQTPD